MTEPAVKIMVRVAWQSTRAIMPVVAGHYALLWWLEDNTHGAN